MQNTNKHEEAIITLSDLVHIFKSHKKVILFFAILMGIIAASFALSRPVLYNIEGTFKDKGKSHTGISGLSMILGGAASQVEGEAMATIKSRKFMEKLIYRRGLQGQLVRLGDHFDLFGSIPSNLKVDYAHFMGHKKPILADDIPPIWAQDIAFNDELTKGVSLKFISNEEFEVEFEGKQLGIGKIGTRFHDADFSFTIWRKTPEALEGSKWVLLLHPLKEVSDNLLNLTSIEADKYDKNLLHVRLLYPNRHVGSEILNSMMLIYQEHIRQEQKRISKEQLEYLNRRQQEMSQEMRKMMEVHAKGMSSEMNNLGFLDVERAIDFFTANQSHYQQKLQEIELAIKKLTVAQAEEYAHYEGAGDTGVINHTLAEIRYLKQQSDLIELGLKNHNKSDTNLQEQLAELELIKNQHKESLCLKNCLQENISLPESPFLIADAKLNVKEWLEKLVASKNSDDNHNTIKEYFTSYIHNLEHLLNMQESIIKERLALQQEPKKEFDGIDIQTSKELFINYSRHLNDVETEIKQLDFMLEQLKNPDFEITSMSSLPNDFVVNEIVSKASQIVQSMKDQNNRSSSEISRLKDQLIVQKEFLSQHLNQSILLKKLKEQLVKEKMNSLQSVTLGLMKQQISVLDKHMRDYISMRLNDLNQESDLIAEHRETLRNTMKDLPKRWVEEKLINQQLIINQKLVQDLAGIVASKNMESNLEILQSYPQDFALPPIHPKSTRSLLYAIFGCFAGGFLAFTYYIVRSALHGVKASVSNLIANHLHVSGFIGSKKQNDKEDKDLDTLRKLSAYMTTGVDKTTGQSIVLLNGKGIDYSKKFIDLLVLRNLKILWISLSAKNSYEFDNNGLLQFLEGKIELPEIHKEEGFDHIYEGGSSPHMIEMLDSPKFKAFLEVLKTKYNWIVVSTDVKATTGKADVLNTIFDHSVVNLTTENIYELKPYMQPTNRKVSFLFSV